MVLLFDLRDKLLLLFFLLVDQHLVLLVLQVVDILCKLVLVEVVVGGVRGAASRGPLLRDFSLLNLNPLKGLI